MNEDIRITYTCYDFKLQRPYAYCILRASGYFPVMISMNTYTMMLQYDIMHTMTLCALPSPVVYW